MAAQKEPKQEFRTLLRAGDPVQIISGGNKQKQKRVRGHNGKILKFIPKKHRVIVEGLNTIKRHKRASGPQDSSGIIEKEGSVHISNVMYYHEPLERPVRLCVRTLDDGRKVRGFLHPETKKFEQIDS